MEPIFQLLDKIFASPIWVNTLSRLSWLDWFAAVLLVIGFLYGMKRGFIREIIEILETCVLIIVVFHFKTDVTAFLQLRAGIPAEFASPVAFLALAIPTWWIIHWIDYRLSKLMHSKLTPLIKVVGGMVLGIVHVSLLLSFVSQVIILIPVQSLRRVFSEGASIAGPMLTNLAPSVYEAVSKPSVFFSKKKNSAPDKSA